MKTFLSKSRETAYDKYGNCVPVYINSKKYQKRYDKYHHHHKAFSLQQIAPSDKNEVNDLEVNRRSTIQSIEIDIDIDALTADFKLD